MIQNVLEERLAGHLMEDVKWQETHVSTMCIVAQEIHVGCCLANVSLTFLHVQLMKIAPQEKHVERNLDCVRWEEKRA